MNYRALILSAALLSLFSVGVIAQKPDLTLSDSCHKPAVVKTNGSQTSTDSDKHVAAAPQEPPPADGQIFCYNYKRPDKKNTPPCKCTYHRDANGKCMPVRQEGPNRCSNHCREDMCKCTNPCKS